MVIIIEGVDAVGKSTQIQKIKEYYEKQGKAVHTMHYSSIKSDNVMQSSCLLYQQMFSFMSLAYTLKDCVLILDRSHIGEVVYSPMYRKYPGDYVYGLEQSAPDIVIDKAKLILFTDEAENIIKRDIERGDGLSFSLDCDKKKEELKAFETAVNKSRINHKIVELKGRTPEQIFEEDVKTFLEEH